MRIVLFSVKKYYFNFANSILFYIPKNQNINQIALLNLSYFGNLK